MARSITTRTAHGTNSRSWYCGSRRLGGLLSSALKTYRCHVCQVTFDGQIPVLWPTRGQSQSKDFAIPLIRRQSERVFVVLDDEDRSVPAEYYQIFGAVMTTKRTDQHQSSGIHALLTRPEHQGETAPPRHVHSPDSSIQTAPPLQQHKAWHPGSRR